MRRLVLFSILSIAAAGCGSSSSSSDNSQASEEAKQGEGEVQETDWSTIEPGGSAETSEGGGTSASGDSSSGALSDPPASDAMPDSADSEAEPDHQPSGPVDGESGTDSGGQSSDDEGVPECEQVACLRAYECVEECGGEVVKSGCCPCGDGTIDQVTECQGTSNSGEQTEAEDSGGDGDDSTQPSDPEGSSVDVDGGASPEDDQPPAETDSVDPPQDELPRECEQVQCLRPYECVRECGGPVISSGCCPCEEGQIDQFIDCR